MMRNHIVFFIALITAFLLAGCTIENSAELQSLNPSTSAISSLGDVKVSFSYVRQDGIATNQFAVWVEDEEGNLVKTLYVTDFTAKGGYKKRKEALPTWVNQSKIADKSKKDIDAISGATPETGILSYAWDCTDHGGNPVSDGEYKFFVEGTLFWESRVLYSGIIHVGGDSITNITAAADFNTENSKNNNMISEVNAIYTPKYKN